MSLEDSPKPPEDNLTIGDKLCTLPPGKANLIEHGVYEDRYEMNHGKYTMYYYVEHVLPNPIHNERGRTVVHWIPFSRKDEFAPGD